MNTLANTIAGQDPVTVTGLWQRHIPSQYLPQALEGRPAPSRWGRAQGFPILYLGRPTDSVVVEAYRRLVDPLLDPVLDGAEIARNVAPRVLVDVDINVTTILDLRTSKARMELGLSLAQIQSEIDDTAAYEACREVAAAAHQQGFHGLVAPAATKVGDTLALFTDLLPASERPQVVGDTFWEGLPDDPRGRRRLTIVREE